MGLATARALAQAGRDVVVCEQFELGHARGSSHGSSRIVRLSYPDERWVRFAQETFPLWRELEAESGRRLLELHGTLDLGDWEPNRDALAACGAPFEVLDAGQIEQPVRHPRRRGRERLVPGGRRDRPCGRSRRGVRRRPRGARARPRRNGRRGRRRRHRGRRARAGGRRHRGRVGARARGRGCDPHGGDRHLLRPRPADAVCHRHDDGRPPRLRARVARRLTEGRSPSIGTPDGPRRARRPRPRALRPHRRLGRAPVSRRWAAEEDGDLPLHDPRGRRIPARAARPGRRRLAVQRPRLQVRAGRRAEAGGRRSRSRRSSGRGPAPRDREVRSRSRVARGGRRRGSRRRGSR